MKDQYFAGGVVLIVAALVALWAEVDFAGFVLLLGMAICFTRA